jgi:hypothetical protein
MEISTARCPVSHSRVTTLATFEGLVTTVICPEFEHSTKTCRIRKSAGLGGPLSQLLERVDEESLTDSGTRCVLA